MNGAIKTAERIQQSLADQSIEFEGKNVSVTLSMGICALNDKHDNFEQLIKGADAAMYKAKENGRNRIEVTDHKA